MATVWFEGIEQLNTISQAIETASGRVGARGADVLRRSALRVEALAKQFCPVDTGNLRNSIGPPEYTGNGRNGSMEATITAHAEYAGFVEWGTARMAPHAFMGPALDRVGPDFIAGLRAIASPLD